MQKTSLKLKEIIFELTGRCLNRCSYCGSKDVWNEEINEDNIKKIVENIASYPPEQIDMSGGDPSLVSYETHKYITDLLKSKNVLCKIILNPKSLSRVIKNDLLGLYDWLGISVNNIEELQILKDTDFNTIKSKSTIITNFNLSNIFEFEYIKKFVKDNNLMWQIQYTVYKDKNILALYENEASVKHLVEIINRAFSEGVKIILADNMNTGTCAAGTQSIGVLSTGEVIGCLSMRSWRDVAGLSQGNLLKDKLEDIWKKRFEDYRFCEFLCCKDHCGNKSIALITKKNSYTFKSGDITVESDQPLILNPPQPYFPNEVRVYGVVTPQTIYYAVITEPYPYDNQVQAYAVKTDYKLTKTNNPEYVITSTISNANLINVSSGEIDSLSISGTYGEGVPVYSTFSEMKKKKK